MNEILPFDLIKTINLYLFVPDRRCLAATCTKFATWKQDMLEAHIRRKRKRGSVSSVLRINTVLRYIMDMICDESCAYEHYITFLPSLRSFELAKLHKQLSVTLGTIDYSIYIEDLVEWGLESNDELLETIPSLLPYLFNAFCRKDHMFPKQTFHSILFKRIVTNFLTLPALVDDIEWIKDYIVAPSNNGLQSIVFETIDDMNKKPEYKDDSHFQWVASELNSFMLT